METTKVHFIRLLLMESLFLTTPLTTLADNTQRPACPMVKIEPERLADLNIPRSGHSIFRTANNEWVVAGGHTAGFVPTPTAEYYADGRWHLINTVYTHDAGTAIPLRSGEVLLAGGFEKHLGIGQTFTAEMYDPSQHAFNGFGCLYKKRAITGGIQLGDGRVIITGNWYHDDGIECYDGHSQFSYIKDVTVSRSKPYIFRLAPNDVLILGNRGIHGEPVSSAVVDRLQGDPLHVPLLEAWQPMHFDTGFQRDDCFIGDEEKNVYANLFAVQDTHGQIAVCLVQDTTFTLLPTTCPIPMRSRWGKIEYISPIVADRQSHRGYMIGKDNTNRLYTICIEYNKTPAAVTLYYTDPLPDIGFWCPMLTANGDLLIAGGTNGNAHSNYTPSATVWLLHFGTPTAAQTDRNGWFWAAGLVILAILAVLSYRLYRHRQQNTVDKQKTEDVHPNELRFQRVCLLMEEQKLYLNSELKISDVAALLGTNSRYVSDCIKTSKGCTFSHFVNTYRINHAKQLIAQQPDIKSIELYLKSGFSNETSFFRTFKSHTGMTPGEWKNQAG